MTLWLVVKMLIHVLGMEKTQTSVVFNIGPIMGLKRKNWAMLQACEYKLVQASGQSVGLHYTCFIGILSATH